MSVPTRIGPGWKYPGISKCSYAGQSLPLRHELPDGGWMGKQVPLAIRAAELHQHVLLLGCLDAFSY